MKETEHRKSDIRAIVVITVSFVTFFLAVFFLAVVVGLLKRKDRQTYVLLPPNCICSITFFENVRVCQEADLTSTLGSFFYINCDMFCCLLGSSKESNDQTLALQTTVT